MKKCRGCGIELQSLNKDKEGYVVNDTFEYCQRCFRLMHYGDASKIKKDINTNKKIINELNKINDVLFVLIVNPFEALFLKKNEYFKDKDILLIINKIDLFPRNFNEEKIERLYRDTLKDLNVECLITHKNDLHFNDLFLNLIKEFNHKNIVFIGKANVGKSTLINKLIGENKLTTSLYPGTTVSFNSFDYNAYKFIDTPGLIDEDSFLTFVDNNLIKKLLPLKTIKPLNFQVYSEQSYFIEGLLELSISPKKDVSLSFLINNNLNVHRTKKENSTNYFNNNIENFSLKLLPLKDNYYDVNNRVFYLKGLGLIIIKGKCKINLRVNEKIKIYDGGVKI